MSRYPVSYRAERKEDPAGLSTSGLSAKPAYMVGPGLRTFPEIGTGPGGFPGTGLPPWEPGLERSPFSPRNILKWLPWFARKSPALRAILLGLKIAETFMRPNRGEQSCEYDVNPSWKVEGGRTLWIPGIGLCIGFGTGNGQPLSSDQIGGSIVDEGIITYPHNHVPIMLRAYKVPVGEHSILPFELPWEWPLEEPLRRLDRRPYVQPSDPFLLPIGEPAVDPRPLPWRTLPKRAPNPHRSPTEQPQRGPQPPVKPRVDPEVVPEVPSRPVPEEVPRVLPLPTTPGISAPEVSEPPRRIPPREDEPDLCQPELEPDVPFEWSEPGTPGVTLTYDGMFREQSPFKGGRPGRGRAGGREIKLKVSVSGQAIRIGGGVTEAVDALEALWDAIPKRECPEVAGGPTGPTCGANVKDCKGRKIKYDPPLHDVPRKLVRPASRPFKQKGLRNPATKRVTELARNGFGRPITHPRPQDMLRDLYNHWDSIDWCSAIENLVKSEIKDFIIGRASKRTARAFGKATCRPVGPSTGPAM